MKTIKFLVPTDFSVCSENATLYAAALAKATGAELHFLHVVIPFVDDNTFLTVDVTSLQEEVKQQMEKQVAEVVSKYGISCTGTVQIGEVREEIVRQAVAGNIDFILMGTCVAQGLEKLFGHTIVSVIENSSCPVIAIPENASFLPWQTIVYATDYENSDIHALNELTRLAGFFGSKIEVVHVVQQTETSGTELSVIDYFSDLVKKSIRYTAINYQVLRAGDVEKGIEKFSRTAEANLVAIATRKRTLLGRLFSKSLAVGLATHSRIPTLIFHVKESDQTE